MTPTPEQRAYLAEQLRHAAQSLQAAAIVVESGGSFEIAVSHLLEVKQVFDLMAATATPTTGRPA